MPLIEMVVAGGSQVILLLILLDLLLLCAYVVTHATVHALLEAKVLLISFHQRFWCLRDRYRSVLGLASDG